MKHEKQVWEKSRMELFRGLGCQELGLTHADAKSRLEKYGANELHAGKQKSVLQIFLGQFADFLVLILILALILVVVTLEIIISVIVCIIVVAWTDNAWTLLLRLRLLLLRLGYLFGS